MVPRVLTIRKLRFRNGVALCLHRSAGATVACSVLRAVNLARHFEGVTLATFDVVFVTAVVGVSVRTSAGGNPALLVQVVETCVAAEAGAQAVDVNV